MIIELLSCVLDYLWSPIVNMGGRDVTLSIFAFLPRLTDQ
jgi:hypothetical protein